MGRAARAAAPAYVGLLAIAAVAVLLRALTTDLDWGAVLTLALLHLGSEWQFSRLWRNQVAITLGSIIVMASVIIVGPFGAAYVSLVSLAIPLRTSVLKRVFNGSQAVLGAYLAGLAYEQASGPVAEALQGYFPAILGPVLLMQIVYVLVNALLLAGVIRLTSGVPVWSFLRGVLFPSVAPYVAYGLFGLLLAALWLDGLNAIAALLLLLPLFIAGWVFAQYAAEKEAYEATVRALVQAVETKDLYTRGHSERVADGAVMTARSRGMREDRIELLRYAALLHDLGKISVPTRVLQKTGRLDDAEFATVQNHPRRGVEMVNDIDFLDEARRGILHHHERVDGYGYPVGLRGDAIPEFARIIAVADAFDAMTTVRSYRGARTVDEARRELQRGSGTQFDPAMVAAFLAALDKFGWRVPDPPIESAAGARPSAGRSSAAAGRESGPQGGIDHDDPSLSLPAVRPIDPGDVL